MIWNITNAYLIYISSRSYQMWIYRKPAPHRCDLLYIDINCSMIWASSIVGHQLIHNTSVFDRFGPCPFYSWTWSILHVGRVHTTCDPGPYYAWARSGYQIWFHLVESTSLSITTVPASILSSIWQPCLVFRWCCHRPGLVPAGRRGGLWLGARQHVLARIRTSWGNAMRGMVEPRAILSRTDTRGETACLDRHTAQGACGYCKYHNLKTNHEKQIKK